MAKDLPYFKFFVSEWNDGDITSCSLEAQGLFVNICSIYWSRGCDGTANALRNLCQRNANAYKELVSAKIIKKKKDTISINFLDEQLNEAKNRSDKNREIALKRWKTDANAMPTHTNGIAKLMPLREDKTRQEEIIKEGKIKILGSGTHYFIVNSNQLHSIAYRIQGTDGLKEFFELNLSSINQPEFAEKFMRKFNTKSFNDFKHVWNGYNQFIEKQFA